uniref:Sec-independent protein translocase component TatC n=1 Tax=Odontella aurita TaxID=265563 RepID=UPI002027D392|nr:Sec-independent protein translocase component TatC [Odontella aurita]QYB22937.1 Sec-independent protein translocase component TatC [Odontella aurita]
MIYNFFYEIQIRSFLIILCWVFTFMTCYYYKSIILFNVVQPYIIFFDNNSGYFIFTDITEVFSTYIYLCSFITNQFIIFIIFYHILLFLTPGLYRFESQFFKNLLIVNIFGWVCVLTLLQKSIVPTSCNFFLTFQNSVTADTLSFYFEAKINEYLNFYVSIYFIFLSSSQFFIFIFLFSTKYIKILREIKIFRKIFYFIFFIFATALTPPDIISQLIVCFSLIIFYEMLNLLSIFYVNIKYNKK